MCKDLLQVIIIDTRGVFDKDINNTNGVGGCHGECKVNINVSKGSERKKETPVVGCFHEVQGFIMYEAAPDPALVERVEPVELHIEIIRPDDIDDCNRLLDYDPSLHNDEKCGSLKDVCFVSKRFLNRLLCTYTLQANDNGRLSGSIKDVYERESHYSQVCVIKQEIIFVNTYDNYYNYFCCCMWCLSRKKENGNVLYGVAEPNDPNADADQIVDKGYIWW